MTRDLGTAVLLTAALGIAGCSDASPTGPTSLDPTAPVSTITALPSPAPVSQTLTGTWSGAGQTFTVTQNGSSVTGMIARRTTVMDEGVTLTESTTITGTVSDAAVTLQMTDRIVISGPGVTMNCTAGHTFIGTLSGNSLTGSVATTASLNCGNDPPAIILPDFNGPVVYTRQ